MGAHSTNYYDTFIRAAEDCPAETGMIPPKKEPRTAARLQYEMMSGSPYVFTSDDLVYAASGAPRGIGREQFFSKGQPCLRACALAKRYGWGIHFDGEGKAALYGRETEAYRNLSDDAGLKQLKAMKNNK